MQIEEVFSKVSKKRDWQEISRYDLVEMLECAMLHIITLEVQATHLTPLALDGAIAPDNQQVLPADVLDGDGVLPEPPRQ